MDEEPDWQGTRISHFDVVLASKVCVVASRENGAISKVAAHYELSVSVVQNAVDRVEIAMGGRPFFVMGKKRTSRLSPDGERFIPGAYALLSAWDAILSQRIE